MDRPDPPMPTPMPPDRSAWRRFREGMRSGLALFQASAYTAGGVGQHPLPQPPGKPKRCAYTVREPALIREALVERPEDFPKSRLMDDMLHSLIGEATFTANGETWRWRRAVVDPALAQARVSAVFQRMLDAANASIDRIGAARTRGPVAVDWEVTHFAADVIFRTLFSEAIEEEVAVDIIRAFDRFQKAAYTYGMMRQLGLPGWAARGALTRWMMGRRIRKALSRPLNRRLEAMTAGRDTPQDDIAASLIRGVDPKTGRKLGPVELLDETATIFLAGHETSASAIAWSLYLLATHPEIQDRMASEVNVVLGDREPAYSDMRKLSLTRNVFKEALRLYPPVAAITRDTVKCERLVDRDAGPDSLILLTPWLMQRQTRFWDRPNAFDPDRFDTAEGREAARQVYFPFSMGPRVCPGAAFAAQESTLLLAMLVRAFVFEPSPGHTPIPLSRLTLRSDNGVLLRISPRNAKA